MAPRIFIFSIILGAEYLSYVKSVETHARTFLPLNISAVGSVLLSYCSMTKKEVNVLGLRPSSK